MAKTPIDFVITGFPNSATGYMAKLLTKIGGCTAGHELSFSHNRHIDFRDISDGRLWGDVSWLAAPYVPELPPNTAVLWQTRDPIKVLDSTLPKKGSLVGGVRAKGPYARFVARTLPDLKGEDEKERILNWYADWHDMLAKQSSDSLAKQGRIDYMYKVEDVASPDYGHLINICFLTGISKKFMAFNELTDRIKDALEHTSQTTNHKSKVTPWSKEYLATHDTEATRRVIDIIKQLDYA